MFFFKLKLRGYKVRELNDMLFDGVLSKHEYYRELCSRGWTEWRIDTYLKHVIGYK